MMWVVLTQVALACPVCGGGGQNAQAFTNTCFFMSAMPLLMMGGLVLYVYRLAQEAKAEDDGTPLLGE